MLHEITAAASSSDLMIQIITGLFIAGIIGFSGFITAMWRCLKKQDARSIRQSRGIMRLTRFIAHEKARLHPAEKFANIEEEIRSDLTDEKGEF